MANGVWLDRDMEATDTTKIAANDLRVGYRYVDVISPAFEDRWTVASVERYQPTGFQILVNGEWADAPERIRVTYRDGREMTFGDGETLHIFCEVPGQEEGVR